MTPRDRAITAALNFAGLKISSSDGTYDTLILVIRDAIEEDRKSRECCKQEREALLKIAEEEKGKPDAPYRDYTEGYLAALDFMIHQIRARSEGEKGE